MLDVYLTQVEGLFLPLPYYFGNPHDFTLAVNNLTPLSADPKVLLQSTLLSAELNKVTGLGWAQPYDLLQDICLESAEFMLANEGLFSSTDFRSMYETIDLMNCDL